MTHRRARAFPLMALLLLLTGVVSASSSQAAEVTFPGDRPFSVFVPDSYSKTNAAPLILALHGYTSSGEQTEQYLKMTQVAKARGILYVHPDGTRDGASNRFWNATPACCNFYSTKVDDGAYLLSIIDAVSQKFNVDQKRIFVIGHSNGGFMTHHMACAYANRIAAVASFSGATYFNSAACKPSKPISVLQIWGTDDETISYNGGQLFNNNYPGALATISAWATLDKCATKLQTSNQKLNLEAKIAGSETTVKFFQGCASKTRVELWSIKGGKHVPELADGFASQVVDFLLAHPKI